MTTANTTNARSAIVRAFSDALDSASDALDSAENADSVVTMICNVEVRTGSLVFTHFTAGGKTDTDYAVTFEVKTSRFPPAALPLLINCGEGILENTPHDP